LLPYNNHRCFGSHPHRWKQREQRRWKVFGCSFNHY